MTMCLDCNIKLGDYRSTRCKSCSKMEKNNPMWKGKNVGYSALHGWVKERLPKPKLCSKCKKAKPYDLTNKTGKYIRKLSHWEWLYRRCHMKEDGRLKKFLSYCVGLRNLRGKDNPNYKHGKRCQDEVFN